MCSDAFELLENTAKNDYVPAIIEPFNKIKQTLEKEVARPATVLDVFAGIGTGVVVLKRLGIAMKKIIHVDHDKIATHVHKHNHDNAYNPSLPDYGDIKHVYEYGTFEELEKSVGTFLERHGRKYVCHGSKACCVLSH